MLIHLLNEKKTNPNSSLNQTLNVLDSTQGVTEKSALNAPLFNKHIYANYFYIFDKYILLAFTIQQTPIHSDAKTKFWTYNHSFSFLTTGILFTDSYFGTTTRFVKV